MLVRQLFLATILIIAPRTDAFADLVASGADITSVVSEPATLILLGSGIIGIWVWARMRRTRRK